RAALAAPPRHGRSDASGTRANGRPRACRRREPATLMRAMMEWERDMHTTLLLRPDRPVDLRTRVEAVDWAGVSAHLDGHGWAMLTTLLTADECESIARLYDDDRRFRSHV